jgi:hypothetical protein
MTTNIKATSTVTDQDLKNVVDSVDQPKPNGPVLAALLGAGVGSIVLGVFTTLAQAHAGFKALMDIDKNLGLAVGVGPLSGKTVYAVAAWLITWAIAGYVMRGKSYEARPFFIATFVLIAIGLLGTFPLFFENFPVLAK